MASYKAVLKRMPCKHFAKSLDRGTPDCPFGRDCFYLHLNADGTEHVFTHTVESFMRESKSRREAAQARRSARQLRELTATLSAFAETLILNAPDVFDDEGNLVYDFGDEYEEESEGEEEEWEDWEDRIDDIHNDWGYY